jgi:hypothetical protein
MARALPSPPTGPSFLKGGCDAENLRRSRSRHRRSRCGGARTRRSAGDAKRKIQLEVTTAGNGHIAVESDEWNVFVDHTAPTDRKLTGRFGQIFLDGKLVYLQSGLISYDVANDVLTDPHPGPMGVQPDACTLLGS